MDRKAWVKRIATERLYRLFEVARVEWAGHPERARRYVELARKIGMRNKVPFPAELKLQYCKDCGTFLVNGKNAVVRIAKGYWKVSCKECGKMKRVRMPSAVSKQRHKVQRGKEFREKQGSQETEQ